MTNIEFYKNEVIKRVNKKLKEKREAEQRSEYSDERIRFKSESLEHIVGEVLFELADECNYPRTMTDLLNWLTDKAVIKLLFEDDKQYLYEIEKFYHCSILSVTKQHTDSDKRLFSLMLDIKNEKLEIEETIDSPSFVNGFENLKIGKQYSRKELAL